MKKWYLSLPFLLLQLSMHAQLEKVLELTGMKPISAAEAEKRVCAATSWVGIKTEANQSSTEKPKHFVKTWTICKDDWSELKTLPTDIAKLSSTGYYTESGQQIETRGYAFLVNDYEPNTLRFYTPNWGLVSSYPIAGGWSNLAVQTQGSQPLVSILAPQNGIYVFNRKGKLMDSLTHQQLRQAYQYDRELPIINHSTARVASSGKLWVYVHPETHRIYCLDEKKQERWSFDGINTTVTDIRLDEARGLVYAISQDFKENTATLSLIDLQTGKKLASCAIDPIANKNYVNSGNTFIFTSNNQSFANEGIDAQLEKVLELTGMKPITAAEAEKRVCAVTNSVSFEAEMEQIVTEGEKRKQYYREYINCVETFTLLEELPGDFGKSSLFGYARESAIIIPGSKYYAMWDEYSPAVRFFDKNWNIVVSHENPVGWYSSIGLTEGKKPLLYICSLANGLFVFNGDGALVDSLTNGYLSSILTFGETPPIPNPNLVTVTGTRKHWTFFHYGENRLYCLDKDKKVKWHYQSKGAISDVRIMEDKHVAVVNLRHLDNDTYNNDSYIMVLDLNTGKELAQCPVQNSYYNQYFNRANTFIFTSNNQSFANE